ncbi:MAG TPA: TadE/TadG family type IV pilus assembly protein [Acidimicrobiales bacterium]
MSRRARGDVGAIAASVALMPIVLTLFFTVIQVSFWYHGRSVATAAAHHALEAARAYDAPAGAGEAAAYEFLDIAGGVDVQDIQVSVAGDVVTVTVIAEPVSIVPGLQKDITVTLQAPQERIVE